MTRSTSRLTVALGQHLIRSGHITKQELVSYCHALAIAGEECWGLNAFTTVQSKDLILEQAEKDGPLAGIPISIKANIAVQEMPLTASSAMLVPPTDRTCGYDADVVRTLKDMGAVVIGITQMDEFGMGSLGNNLGERRGSSSGSSSSSSHPGRTKNPLPFLTSTTRTRTQEEWIREIQKPYDQILEDHGTAHTNMEPWYTGGSSCGSAASVSHGSSLVSIASDTGGSIRLPAAWCGITGFKPSYGTLSRKGLVSYASSLDTVGCLAPSADCISIIMHQLESAKQPITTDSTMVHRDSSTRSRGASTLRVGIPSAFSVEECPLEIQNAWAAAANNLEQNGATLVELSSDVISPDIVRASLAAYYIIASAEASSNLSRYDGLRFGLHTEGTEQPSMGFSLLESKYAAARSLGFGQEVLRRILSGTSVLSSDRFHTHYEAATKIRALLSKQMRHALDGVDVLLTPTCLSMPNTTMAYTDPTEMFANDVLTVPVSLACLPAMSIPWWTESNQPIGLQIVGSSDDKVIEVAMQLQNAR